VHTTGNCLQPHRGALRPSRYMTMQLSLERTTGSSHPGAASPCTLDKTPLHISRIQRAFVSQLGPSSFGTYRDRARSADYMLRWPFWPWDDGRSTAYDRI